MPFFSIITINYNNKEGLKNTIKSVQSQLNRDFEYIVIDGASIDGSVDVILQNVISLDYWVSETDNGIYHAINKGIAKATGKYLLFLNSGDNFIDEMVLQKSYDFLLHTKDIDIYYGDIIVVNHPSHSDGIHWKHPHELDMNFLKVETINHQAALIRASLFKEFGPYPEMYKLAADYWLWLKSMLNNKKFIHLGFPMVYYDFSGISSTNRALYLKEKEEIWNDLVPRCIQTALQENNDYKQLVEYKLVKAAICLNTRYQALKNSSFK